MRPGRRCLPRLPRLRRRRPDERGATAVLIALMVVLLFMAAAWAVDIGFQVNRKQQLNDTLDAAAQAGAFALPGSSVTARSEALTYAAAHDGTETGALAPNVDFWCVVASVKSGAVYVVDTTQVPATCYPGTAPYTVNANYKATGRKTTCSVAICAIPCVEPTPNTGTPKVSCNTIRVYQGRDVPFAFAPAGGIQEGGTGDLVSVACKGPCGVLQPNPMDVVVVADRTRSMSSAEVSSMISGIQGMLRVMTPSQQYVALGAIGRSSSDRARTSGTCTSSTSGLTYPSSSGTSGAWVPIAFDDDYLTSTGALQSSSNLVRGLNCLSNQSDIVQGTALAQPMKAAARYLLGQDANNLAGFPARSIPPLKVLIFETDGQPNESQPTGGSTSLGVNNEVYSNRNDSTSSSTVVGPTSTGTQTTTRARTVGSGYNAATYTDTYVTAKRSKTTTTTTTYDGGQVACDNLKAVSAAARQAGILVITIGYNLGQDAECNDFNRGTNSSGTKISLPANTTTSDDETTITNITPAGAKVVSNGKISLNTSYRGAARIEQTTLTSTEVDRYNDAASSGVLDVLAQSAGDTKGVAANNHDCSTSTGKSAENSDGDFFFCAASGDDMSPIFKTALGQVTTGIKLLKIPQ